VKGGVGIQRRVGADAETRRVRCVAPACMINAKETGSGAAGVINAKERKK
jgi:hypothetical protein